MLYTGSAPCELGAWGPEGDTEPGVIRVRCGAVPTAVVVDVAESPPAGQWAGFGGPERLKWPDPADLVAYILEDLYQALSEWPDLSTFLLQTDSIYGLLYGNSCSAQLGNCAGTVCGLCYSPRCARLVVQIVDVPKYVVEYKNFWNCLYVDTFSKSLKSPHGLYLDVSLEGTVTLRSKS